METFFQTHAYLIEHTNLPVRRALMDSIDWSYRLIGIRGPRGVGRTSFLLQYAKEHYDVRLRTCLYINCNSFYFQGHNRSEKVIKSIDYLKGESQFQIITGGGQ